MKTLNNKSILQRIANIIEIKVEPTMVYTDQIFKVHARTDLPAYRVQLEIDGEKYDMLGSGTEWSLEMKTAETGRKKIVAMAQNFAEIYGEKGYSDIFIEHRPFIKEITFIPPENIDSNELFIIKLKTEIPAKRVQIYINDKTYIMDESENK